MATGTMQNGTIPPADGEWESGAASINERIEQYLPMVRRIANRFCSGAQEPEDLLQEGLIGLLYAVRTYDAGRQVSFSAFAYRCILNRVLTAVSSGKGRQNVSLSALSDESVLPKRLSPVDPQEVLIAREEAQRWLQTAQKKLSPLEYRVLRLHLAGYSYEEIARRLAVGEKTIDNALWRARKKLRAGQNNR